MRHRKGRVQRTIIETKDPKTLVIYRVAVWTKMPRGWIRQGKINKALGK